MNTTADDNAPKTTATYDVVKGGKVIRGGFVTEAEACEWAQRVPSAHGDITVHQTTPKT